MLLWKFCIQIKHAGIFTILKIYSQLPLYKIRVLDCKNTIMYSLQWNRNIWLWQLLVTIFKCWRLFLSFFSSDNMHCRLFEKLFQYCIYLLFAKKATLRQCFLLNVNFSILEVVNMTSSWRSMIALKTINPLSSWWTLSSLHCGGIGCVCKPVDVFRGNHRVLWSESLFP